MSALDDIFSRARKLTPTQRLALAHRLLSSDEPATADEINEAWDREIRERITELDAGRSATRPASDVFNDIDQRFAH